MENINVQVYSLVSEPISPIEKLKTIAKLGFAGAEFTADFTEVLCRVGRKACHLPGNELLQQGRS